MLQGSLRCSIFLSGLFVQSLCSSICGCILSFAGEQSFFFFDAMQLIRGFVVLPVISSDAYIHNFSSEWKVMAM